MNFNVHSGLHNQHAFLSGSKYHWIRYTDEKLEEVYKRYLAVRKGSELHDLASKLISLGVKLPRSEKTLNRYVNDAIGYRMSPEIVLFYSRNAFGTADAISFRKSELRIHDLKTGIVPASTDQLWVYTALFCLEYKTNPNDITIELRLYQADTILIEEPDPMGILRIMEKIRSFDKKIESILEEENS